MAKKRCRLCGTPFTDGVTVYCSQACKNDATLKRKRRDRISARYRYRRKRVAKLCKFCEKPVEHNNMKWHKKCFLVYFLKNYSETQHNETLSKYTDNNYGTRNAKELAKICENLYGVSSQEFSDLEKTRRGKTVICVETGETFVSEAQAAKKTIISRQAINECLNGKAKTAAGFHWEYFNQEEEKQHE